MSDDETQRNVPVRSLREDVDVATQGVNRLLAQLEEVTGGLIAKIEGREPKHRLLRLRNEVIHLRDAFENHARDSTAGIEASFISLTELAAHIALLDDAKTHLSDWDVLLGACSKPETYDHFILTLSLRNVLRNSWGLQAELVPEIQGTRTPDLMIYQGGSALCAVELKSKLALADPGGALTYKQAQNIIKHAIASIGGSEDGQLRAGFPGLLAIGGFFIPPTLSVLLKAAALDWFKRHPGRKKSLAGVMFVNLLVTQGEPPNDRAQTFATDVQFARNRSYNLDTNFLIVPSGTTLQMSEHYNRWGPDVKLLPPGSVIPEGWHALRGK